MSLDFTGLESIKGNTKTNHMISEGQAQIKIAAERKLEKQAEYIKGCREVYKKYQDARKISQCLQWEIMKGVNNSEDIKELFLKATETISLLTGTKSFYTQIEKQIKEKY